MNKAKRRLIINILAGMVIVVSVLTFYSTFSMDTEYVFKSDVYDISDGYIEGISINTSIDLFYKYFDMDNCSIKVMDKDNKEVSSGYVGNGTKTVLYGANGNVVSSYVNVIKGDYNGDGILDNTDFYEMGKCLVEECVLDEIKLKSIDIDGDSEFHINDVVLLDKDMTLGYTGVNIEEESIVLQSNEVGRLVGKVSPNYGVNMNLKWESADNKIATVDEAGRVTGGMEGEVIIKAITLDGKYVDEAKVIVDNTIQLESYEGLAYIGGNDVRVWIKSVSYEGLSCVVGDEEVASCKIDGEMLVLSGKNIGSTSITVNSSQYGSVTYNLIVRSVYLNIMPDYLCMHPGESQLITVSGFNTGNLSFEFNDRDIIKDAYMTMYGTRNMLRIDAGNKQGRGILTVREDNGNTSGNVIIDVTSLSMAEMGIFGKVGEESSLMAIGDNLGKLTCVSSDENIGTCRVEENRVIVMPKQVGLFYVDVYNNFTYEGYQLECGQTQFTVVVQE